MKNIQFTSREMDYKFLAVPALAVFFGVLGMFPVFLLPQFGKFHGAPWILGAISAGLALFVWSIFRLIEPAHYTRGWKIAEITLVPLYWLVLLLAAYVGLGWFIDHSIQQIQNLVTNCLGC